MLPSKNHSTSKSVTASAIVKPVSVKSNDQHKTEFTLARQTNATKLGGTVRSHSDRKLPTIANTKSHTAFRSNGGASNTAASKQTNRMTTNIRLQEPIRNNHSSNSVVSRPARNATVSGTIPKMTLKSATFPKVSVSSTTHGSSTPRTNVTNKNVSLSKDRIASKGQYSPRFVTTFPPHRNFPTTSSVTVACNRPRRNSRLNTDNKTQKIANTTSIESLHNVIPSTKPKESQSGGNFEISVNSSPEFESSQIEQPTPVILISDDEDTTMQNNDDHLNSYNIPISVQDERPQLADVVLTENAATVTNDGPADSYTDTSPTTPPPQTSRSYVAPSIVAPVSHSTLASAPTRHVSTTFIDLTNDTFSLDSASDGSSVVSDLSDLAPGAERQGIFSDHLPPIRSAGIIGVSFNQTQQDPSQDNDTMHRNPPLLGSGLSSTASSRISYQLPSQPESLVAETSPPITYREADDLTLPRPLPRTPPRTAARTSPGVSVVTISPGEGASAPQPSMATDELLAHQMSQEINAAEQQRHRRFMTAVTTGLITSRLRSLRTLENHVAPSDPPDPHTSEPPPPPTTADAPLSSEISDSRNQQTINTTTSTGNRTLPPHASIARLIHLGDDLMTNIIQYRGMTDDILDENVLMMMMLVRRLDLLTYNLMVEENDYDGLWDLSERLGEVRNPGLTEDDIAKLPWQPYVTGTNVESQCRICLASYEADEKVRYLDCKHDFHADCIDEWLKVFCSQRKATCPICRKDLNMR